MTTSMPFLDVRLVGDVRVVEFTRTDMTDASFIKNVGDEIYRIALKIDHPKIVIDFGKVQRLSSATLGMLVALKKVVVEQRGGQLSVSNVADNLRDIFRMTKLQGVLKICESTEDAVESMGKG